MGNFVYLPQMNHITLHLNTIPNKTRHNTPPNINQKKHKKTIVNYKKITTFVL